MIAGFIWSSKVDERRRHWVALNQLSKPKAEGGLGIRRFEYIQAAFRVKQAWNILNGSSLWVKVFRNKFLRGKHLLSCGDLEGVRSFKFLKPWFEFVVSNSLVIIGNGQCELLV